MEGCRRPPLAIKVVIVTAFPPELETWIRLLPLSEELPFPQSPIGSALRLHRSLGVLGIVSGMGPFRAATSVLALGYDDRFDLRQSYWIVAGIAGVDPRHGSIGSVFLPERLIGSGGDYFVDGVGHVPHNRTDADYSPPFPTARAAVMRGMLHELHPPLVARALAIVSAVTLPDTRRLREARDGYVELAARRAPSIARGDSLTGGSFWVGRTSTEWARNGKRLSHVHICAHVHTHTHMHTCTRAHAYAHTQACRYAHACTTHAHAPFTLHPSPSPFTLTLHPHPSPSPRSPRWCTPAW